MKKLLTVTKSKFYMLRVNFPYAFEQPGASSLEAEHDPLAERKREAAPALEKPATRVSLDDDEDSMESQEKRKEVLAKDKARFEALDAQTAELVKQMEVLKQVDEMNREVIARQQEELRKRRYVEREEDPEIKRLYEQEQERFLKMQETLGDKIDGEIDMDLHGNFTFRPAKGKEEVKTEGIQGPGTYVLRDGKLVPGKAEVREQA